jgi:hypothetical protein
MVYVRKDSRSPVNGGCLFYSTALLPKAAHGQLDIEYG